jgi:hypothetical protein
LTNYRIRRFSALNAGGHFGLRFQPVNATPNL